MSLKDGRSGRIVLLLTERPEWLHLGLDDEQGRRTVRMLVHKQTLQLAIAEATRRSGAVRELPVVFGLREEGEVEPAADAAVTDQERARARVPLRRLATAHAGRGWRR